MKHHLPPLDSLKAFEAAARHLSFSLAANELCITKGAISYQIRKLEEELQCPLFKRSVRQVYLTEAGQKLFQTTKLTFEQLGITFSQLQEVKQQTSVTIAATTYVAARWLSSRIGRFNEEYPEINIILQHTVNTTDFKLEDVDLAILWGPCLGRLDKQRFAEIQMPMFPVISPNLLTNKGILLKENGNIKNILNHPMTDIPLLCEERQLDTWNTWFNNNKPQKTLSKLNNPRRVIADANVRVQAAIDGQGFILADNLMSNEINNGLLIAPFEEKLTDYGYAFYSSTTKKYSNNAIILKEWFINNI